MKHLPRAHQHTPGPGSSFPSSQTTPGEPTPFKKSAKPYHRTGVLWLSACRLVPGPLLPACRPRSSTRHCPRGPGGRLGGSRPTQQP